MQSSQVSISNIHLEKFLNLNFKGNIIKVIERNGKKLVKGTVGHNSFFFKKPIIQGKFYLQMIGHFPEKLTRQYNQGPSFRVGVAPTEYYYNYPLGQLFSIGYKMNGCVIQLSGQKAKLEPYKFGDIIGIGISINSIHKIREKQKIDKENFIQFFKNGKSVGEKLYLLTEDLFSFSGSLFNQSQIEVNFSQQTIKYLPEGYAPYAKHLTERCKYTKDIELMTYQNQIFEILKNLN